MLPHQAKIAAHTNARENPDHEFKRRLPHISGVSFIDAIRA
jgi:hypothetical protein